MTGLTFSDNFNSFCWCHTSHKFGGEVVFCKSRFIVYEDGDDGASCSPMYHDALSMMMATLPLSALIRP
jgi:hypothetical protein